MIAASTILDFLFSQHFRLVYWPQLGDNKGPRESGWTEKPYPRDAYREGFRVGILCGVETSPGHFLHDVDIDWAAGSVIAQALLPATDFMYGRASKRISHCFYTTPTALPSFKYEDPTDNATLIELRGTKLDGSLGFQTMCPPSVWSKDTAFEPLQFVRMQVPAHIEDSKKFSQAVCLSAIAMLLAKHCGKKGFNHEIRMAWAGFLLRAGLTPDECIKMGEAIFLYTGNADKEDVCLAVNSTMKRLADKDKKVKGGPAFAKMLGEHGKALVKQINGWLGRDSDWIRNADGIIIKDHQENVVRALAALNVELSYNEFSDKLLVNKTQPLEDRQLNDLWFRIDEECRFRPPMEFFERSIKHIAWQNTFHPVREYFDTLTWDGTPRIDEWLITAASAVDSPYVRAISAIMLIAAVRRIKQPGCKYDEMVVLESAQGLQKSSALAALCPTRDWFTDDFQLNVSSQRTIESTLGKWIIEVSELSGMRGHQVELLRSNLSRQVDGPTRLAYAHLPMERQRQFILIGTTNSKTYLADPTGARRFWPIEVKKFDVHWIITNRDQLWAEAVQREAAGESNRLPEALWGAAGVEQEERRELDPWEHLLCQAIMNASELHDYKDKYTRVPADALWDALGVIPERRVRKDQVRISEIMQRLGFKRTKVRPPGGNSQAGYVSIIPKWAKSKFAQSDPSEEIHDLNPAATRPIGNDDDIPF